MAINEPDPKVYCDNCIFFIAREPHPPTYDFGPPEYQLERCLAPENFRDTYSKQQYLPISQPKVINQHNDCVWYIAEESPSSSSSCHPHPPHPPHPPVPPTPTLQWTQEIVCGSATGTDTNYILSYTPYTMYQIYINGVLQRPTVDYSLVGNTIIFGAVVEQGSNIQAIYNYLA